MYAAYMCELDSYCVWRLSWSPCNMLSMRLAIKCITVCSIDVYIIGLLMSCYCYVMFDLTLVLVLVLVLSIWVLVLVLALTVRVLVSVLVMSIWVLVSVLVLNYWVLNPSLRYYRLIKAFDWLIHWLIDLQLSRLQPEMQPVCKPNANLTLPTPYLNPNTTQP